MLHLGLVYPDSTMCKGKVGLLIINTRPIESKVPLCSTSFLPETVKKKKKEKLYYFTPQINFKRKSLNKHFKYSSLRKEIAIFFLYNFCFMCEGAGSPNEPLYSYKCLATF